MKREIERSLQYLSGSGRNLTCWPRPEVAKMALYDTRSGEMFLIMEDRRKDNAKKTV